MPALLAPRADVLALDVQAEPLGRLCFSAHADVGNELHRAALPSIEPLPM